MTRFYYFLGLIRLLAGFAVDLWDWFNERGGINRWD